MEAIKNAIGLGSSQLQSGKEPASGHTGSGTVSEPYDAGNTAGQSGLATNESTKVTTDSNTYSAGDTGTRTDNIDDQLSSTATGNASNEPKDPKAIGQSESLSSAGSTFRQMSDIDAAKVLSEQNAIFSNDSLSVQERLHQFYMLLIRYDRGSGNSVPETPKPVEHSTNPIGGAIESSGGEVPSTNQKHIEEEHVADHPQVDDAVEEPAEAQTKTTLENTQVATKPASTTHQESGTLVHEESEVLHDGQNKEEEINVPVAGADNAASSNSDVGATAASTGKPGESEAVNNVGLGETNVKATSPATDGEHLDAAKPGLVEEADRLPVEKRIQPDVAAEAASTNSDQLKPSEPTKKSKSQKLKEKLHIGRK